MSYRLWENGWDARADPADEEEDDLRGGESVLAADEIDEGMIRT